MVNKKRLKYVVPSFSKYRVIKKEDKYIVQVPAFYFFWKPLQIKIIGRSLDFLVDAEFYTKSEVQDFIKYKFFNTKRIEELK